MGTVFVLGIPAVLLLVVTIPFVLIRLISPIGGGIGGFAFGVTWRELMMGAAIMLGVFLLLCFLGRALVRRHKQRPAG